MIPAGLAAGWAGLGKWRWPLVIGLLAALALTLAYCKGGATARQGERMKQAEAAAKVDARADTADAAAADARVADARRDLKQKQELEDAAKGAVSADDARRRRGCAIMRQQRIDTAAIAECR